MCWIEYYFMFILDEQKFNWFNFNNESKYQHSKYISKYSEEGNVASNLPIWFPPMTHYIVQNIMLAG